MTTIELKEQIKMLRQHQRDAEKEQKKLQREYHTWSTLMCQHASFRYVNNFRNKYNSFEALIIDEKWTNTIMDKIEFEFLFSELGYTDIEFFTAFMNWDNTMLSMPMEDRKCCICISYYTSAKTLTKFNNCSHAICSECYIKLAKKADGYKQCVICRASEKPKRIHSLISPSDIERNLDVNVSL